MSKIIILECILSYRCHNYNTYTCQKILTADINFDPESVDLLRLRNKVLAIMLIVNSGINSNP